MMNKWNSISNNELKVIYIIRKHTFKKLYIYIEFIIYNNIRNKIVLNKNYVYIFNSFTLRCLQKLLLFY